MRATLGARWLSLGLAAAGCGPTSICGDGGLDAGTICLHPMGGSPTHWGFAPGTLQVADVDGDGHLDVATANHARGTVTVVWGGPTALEGTATTWSVGPEVAGLAVADFDGDGRLDLATAEPGAGAVAVLLGRGGRSLDPILHRKVGAGPRAVLAADLDGAAPPELIAANTDDGTVSVLLHLSPMQRTVVGPGPRGLAAGDLDGDGHLDLAVSLDERDAVQVLLGDGAGGLTPGVLHPVGGAPEGVVTADFDADGALDIASADALDDTVTLLFGDGAGGLRKQVTFPVDPEPRTLAVLRDGAQPPLLGVLSDASSTVQRLDPRQGTVLTGASSAWASALAAGDLDDDGRDELLYGSALRGELGTLRPGTGLRAKSLWQALPIPTAFPVELDGDPVDELVIPDIGNADRPGLLELWRNDRVSAVIDTRLGETVLGARSDNFTGSGRRDIIVWGETSAAVLVQDADGLLNASTKYLLPGPVTSLAAADIDGDARPEVILAVAAGADQSRLQVLTSNVDGLLNMAHEVKIAGAVKSLTKVERGEDGTALLALTNNALGLLTDVSEPQPVQWIDLQGAGVPNSIAVSGAEADGVFQAFVCTSSQLLNISNLMGAGPVAVERLSPPGCDALFLTDLNDDGVADILLQRHENALRDVRVVLTPLVHLPEGWSALGNHSVPGAPMVQLARLDADALPDVLIGGPDTLTRAFGLTLDLALTDTVSTRLGADLELDFVELDGDHALDLFAHGTGVAVAFSDGRGNFGPMEHHDLDDVLVAPQLVTSVISGDFDADGRWEGVLAVQRAEAWSSELHVLSFNRGGEMRVESTGTVPVGDVRLVAGNVEADFMVDLLALGGGPEPESFLLSNQNGRLSEARRIQARVPSSEYRSRLADLNNDGHLDIVSQTSNDGLTYNAGAGNGTFGPWQIWSAVEGVQEVAFSDLDRDGWEDAVLISGGRLMVQAGAGSTTKGPPVLLLEGISTVALADLDADGQPEILAAGPDGPNSAARSKLYLGRSSGGFSYGFIASSISIATPYAIRTGDYNGDAFLDVAILGSDSFAILEQLL